MVYAELTSSGSIWVSPKKERKETLPVKPLTIYATHGKGIGKTVASKWGPGGDAGGNSLGAPVGVSMDGHTCAWVGM